ncbi:MAG: DUF4241 domain-containing protein [Candidatus Nanopelagicales bacterium]
MRQGEPDIDGGSTMRRTPARARRAALLVAAATVLAACGVGPGPADTHRPEKGIGPVDATPSITVDLQNVGPTPTGDGSDATAEPVDPSLSSSAPLAADAPRYVACRRTTAPRGSTHLSPPSRVDASNGRDVDGKPVPHGRVTLESGSTLVLDDGRLGAGNGYEAAIGGTRTMRVSARPVAAPVTLAVLDSPQTGRRVAFVEVQISRKQPVRWVQQPTLNIVTDGGDGGFATGTAQPLRDDQTSIDAYVDAYDSAGTPEGQGVCAQRISSTGTLESVLFYTGYGDGVYPTFFGYDASGSVASAVFVSYVLPWKLSGLPGTPPPTSEAG